VAVSRLSKFLRSPEETRNSSSQENFRGIRCIGGADDAFRIMDVIKFQSQKGTGVMTLWDFEKSTIDTLLAGPGARKWRRERPYNFNEDFVFYVEKTVLPKYEK
jgi:hypothetical protein